jgi:hypothetical protein
MWQTRDTVALIGLGEFFEGNRWWFSIAVNLGEDAHPGTTVFHNTLRAVRDRPDVQDVLIEVADLTEPDQEWLYSDCVFVLTSACVADIREWVAPLFPSMVHEGWSVPPGVRVSVPERTLTAGMRPVRVWWD